MRTMLRHAGWRTRPRRRWISDVAPLLAAAEPAGRGWQTESVRCSDTFVTVAVVRCPESGRRYVVKMPRTAEGVERLHRQADVLAALHRDPRLAGWLAVVPRHLAHAEVDGRSYWVEEAVPGSPLTAAMLRNSLILDQAVTLIEDLHSRTGEERIVDQALIDEWVHRPLAHIGRFCLAHPHYLPAVDRLRAELSSALAGRTVRTCWIHGDFWPGNLLASGPTVTGVVDWDQARPHHLPLHDLLHIHVFARRQTLRCELGDVVVGALRDGAAEAIGASRQQMGTWLQDMPERSAVLMYWLRHVALFFDSEGHGDNPRWVRRNVESVLAQA
jgi:aminoglycoside phosphotransferase (APT) family kinase protein